MQIHVAVTPRPYAGPHPDLGYFRRARLGFGMLVAGWVLLSPGPAWADFMSDARQSMQKGDVKTAVLQLRNAVKADPQNAEARFLLARVHLELGDVVAAQKEAQNARDRGYDPRQVIPLLTQTYLLQGRFREVLQDFRTDGHDPVVDASILVARGYANSGLRNFDEAQQSFAEAEKLAPDAVQPALAGARLALARGDMATARLKADHALALDSKSADAQLFNGQLLRAKGDNEAALTAFDKLLADNPTNGQGRLERAQLYLAMNRDDKALADDQALLAVKPNDGQALYLKALLLARAKDYKGADLVLDRLSTMISRLPRAYFLQAVVKQNLGNLEQAEEAATRYLARAPEDIEAYKLFARIELQKGKPAPVVESLNKLEATGRGDAESFDLLGRALTLTGQPKLAAEAFQKAQALAPENVGVNTRLAGARLGAGDSNEAVLDLERSLRLTPNDAAVGEALFFAALSTGDTDRAASELERIRAVQGETPSVGNLQGVLAMARLQLDVARQSFEAVIRQDPSFNLAKLNLARLAAMEGHPEETESILSAILAKQSTSEPTLSMYVAAVVSAGNVSAAVTAIERAHADAPNDARLTAVLADLYIRGGDPTKALALAGADKDLQTLAPELLAARARAQLAMKQAKDARDTYALLLDREPGNVAVRRILASLLVAGGDVESARNVLQKGLTDSPRDMALINDTVALDLRAGGLDAGLATADRLQRQNPNFEPVRALKGDLYLGSKQYDKAIEAYKAAMNEGSADSGLTQRLASATAMSGKPEDAKAQLTTWLQAHPDDLAVLQYLSGININDRNYKDAQAQLLRILDKRPNDPGTLNNLAWIYQQLGDKRARATAQRAYVLLSNAQTADTLGWILVGEGDKSGLVMLRQANAEGGATDPRIKYHYAVALKQGGDREQAVKLLTQVVASEAAFDEKAAAKTLLEELSKKS